jgi:hypothetical protein
MVTDVDGCTYRVVVAGELGPRFDNAFEGMTVTAANGQTEIRGHVADRAQLRALLERVDDFGLTLIGLTVNGATRDGRAREAV